MRKILAALAIVLCSMAETACSQEGVTVSVVEDAPGYNCWPMIQPVGNRLVCIYTIGKEHDPGEKNRSAWARYSDDGGRSWSEKILIDGSPEYGTSSIGKGTDKEGNALFWIRRLHADRRMALYRTTDGERFEQVSTPPLNPLPMQITDIFHTPEGLVCLWFSDDYSDAPNKSWGTLTSRDDGRTWKQRTVEDSLSRKEWPTEPSVAVLGDGRLLAIARCEDIGESLFQLTSSDWGKTWQKTRTNIDDVHQSTPTLIYDERKELIYTYYYQRGAGLLKLRVARCRDILEDAAAWPEPVVLAEGGRERPHDSGNANAVAMGRRHFITYYSGDPVNCQVLVASLNPRAEERLSPARQR